ncbi:MAG: cobalt ECF transporter T component CbiQ [Candidatus Bathyarchaeales archaeon]
MHTIHLDFEENLGGNTLLYRLDARVKLVCTVFAIFSILFLTHWQTAALIFVSCLFLAFYFAHAHMKIFLRRLLYPLYIIAVVSVIQPFTYGSTVATITPIFSIPIYIEGLWFAFLIFTRCLAAVAVLNLLILTTPIMTVMGALEWFKVPSTLIDVALLMFRYIFVISDEATTIYNAQKSRCGYSKTLGYFKKLKNYGTLFGMLFVRSYDRAVKVGNAMISRGYKGETKLFTFHQKAIPPKEVFYGIILILATASLILVDWFIL